MKNKSYIAISFIVLLFGIYAIPKIVNKVKNKQVVEGDRLNKVVEGKLSYLIVNNEKRKMPKFSFINQDSLMITNTDYKNKVYVVEFFFSTCPTICPIMNKNMKTLEAEYGQHNDFGIASFSINPDYDTPMILKEYAEKYEVTSMNWNFLTGRGKEVFELSNKGLNIFTEINPEVAGGFEHQGYFALVDKNGYLRSRRDQHGNPIVYYQGTEKEQVALLKEDIKKLLEE